MKKILFILLCTLLVSCSNNFVLTEDTQIVSCEISDQSYSSIKNQAYMGGSVIYNPFDYSTSHLFQGVKVLTRLGNVSDTQNGWADVEEKAQYGYITVLDISEEGIFFTYSEIQKDNTKSTLNFHIRTGQSIDLNGDNSVDLLYEIPTKKRTGFENSRYLTFISSTVKHTTSMFCIMPSQYGDNYPGGIMGVNPYGKFIVTKYSLNDNNRCAISGLQYGDYVLDRNLGKYQKVISNLSSSRALTEQDIEDFNVSSSNLFDESDFCSKEQISNFVAAVRRDGLLNNKNNSNSIFLLNTLLKDYDLIKKASDNKLILDVDEDAIEQAIPVISNFDLDMLVYTNRSFLTYLYPEYCSEKNYVDIAEIFPLLFCNLGGCNDFENSNIIDSRSIMTTNYYDYSKKKDAINAEYKKYFNLPFGLDKYTIIKNDKNKDDMGIIDFDCKIGLQGKIENEWGSKLGLDIAVIVYTNFESRLNFSKNIVDTSLIGGKKNICKLRFPINLGIVCLSIDCPLDFDLRFSINTACSYPIPINTMFTGLFGAEVGAGVNYSVTWKKILFIPYPSLSSSLYSSSKLINEATCFIGFTSDNVADLFMPENTSITFTLSPQFILGAELSALDCVSIGVNGSIGVDGRFPIASKKDPIKLIKQNQLPITGSVGLYLAPTKINGICKIHLPSYFDTLFHLKWSKEFKIKDVSYDVELCSYVLF